jgi:gliding motility-associated protein GldM
MAGGKLSARQKMINLMYLVFIAMLAMNMDKKVLTNIGRGIDNDIETSKRLTATNAASLASLSLLASNQKDKYEDKSKMANALSKLSNDFNSFLDGVTKSLKSTLKPENQNNFEKMDTRDAGDHYFFKGDKYTKEGQEFLDRINKYREDVKQLLGPKTSEEILSNIDKRFNTSKVKMGNKQVDYLYANYEGYPLISTLSNISRLQLGIKNTENDVYGAVVKGQMTSDVSLKNYQAMVVFDKNAYYPGEKLSGKIVLGKNDPTLRASKVILNGVTLKEDRIQAGQVTLAGSAGNVGEKEIKGTFYFQEGEETIEIPIEGGKYSVIPKPNQAIISADKMNVVYRGVSNPISISMPGVPKNRIRATAPGLNPSKNGYIMIAPKQREVTINVSAKLDDGSTVNSKKLFRVKDIPSPTGTIRGQSGYQKMSKSSLLISTIGSELKDFVFDLKIGVTSFMVKVPGKPAIKVNGTRFTDAAKRAIKRAKRGDVINIINIKSYLKTNTGYKLKKTSDVSVEITS